MEAQFSTPFVIASYLLDPTPNPNWFTPDKFNDPRIMELAKCVQGTIRVIPCSIPLMYSRAAANSKDGYHHH